MKAPAKKRLVLLDAHAILHRAYHALPDFTSPTGEPTGALYGVVAMLLRIVEDLQPDYIVACYDLPEPTYRHLAYTDYKAKREKTDDSLVVQIDRSRAIFLAFGIPIYEKPGFEADDILGTIAHVTKEEKALEIIIASGDMDTMQCIDGKRVRVFTLKRGLNDTVLYDEDLVKERFGFPPTLIPDYKGLRGDTSDNIPGIVGVGEKTATELVSKFGSLENIYKQLKSDEEIFKTAKIKPRIIELLKKGEEEAQFSKMLATIRTDVPIKFQLPTEAWRQSASPDQILALFSELGFRTLTTRVKTLFEINEARTSASGGEDATKVKAAAIWLWLLDSERTSLTAEEIVEYGRSFLKTRDFDTTYEALKTAIKSDAALWAVYTKIEAPLVPIVEAMNQAGIKLDTNYLAGLAKTMHSELAELEAKIHTAAGLTFNINSPKQLGGVLFDDLGLKPKNQKKTAGGQRSTKESELEKLKGEHPIIDDILRYRELQKLVSTYVDALPLAVGADGRVRTTFVQTGTTTGRLASRDPNLQNIPTSTKEGRSVRRAFVAEEGWSLVAIDYSQIELRIAAILSHDANLIEIFKRREDVHTGVAVRVFGVTAEAVTSEMRRKAKVINFGILYGMGVNALRTNLGEGTSREEAQSFLNAYFNTFSRLADYLDETKALAAKLGYTETLFGRRRHFPGLRSTAPFIRAQAERMAINAPIQGTAADCIRLAMVAIGDLLKESKSVRPLLQVHDELIFEIETKRLTESIPALVARMESVLKGKETYGVPLEVRVAVGPNWADLKAWES